MPLPCEPYRSHDADCDCVRCDERCWTRGSFFLVSSFNIVFKLIKTVLDSLRGGRGSCEPHPTCLPANGISIVMLLLFEVLSVELRSGDLPGKSVLGLASSTISKTSSLPVPQSVSESFASRFTRHVQSLHSQHVFLPTLQTVSESSCNVRGVIGSRDRLRSARKGVIIFLPGVVECLLPVLSLML